MEEPSVKRAIAFVDGQNLFYASKEAFGYTFPNYDIGALARAVCSSQGWSLVQTRFYTGIPSSEDHEAWNHFWTAKLAQMGREGVWHYARPLRYRNERISLPGGAVHTRLVGSEKGIDVRVALDIVGLARRSEYDVALIFSQDQDLSEVATEIRHIGREQGRWIKVASAYPHSPTSRNQRGINGTDWLRVSRATYDACIDTRDYRGKFR